MPAYLSRRRGRKTPGSGGNRGGRCQKGQPVALSGSSPETLERAEFGAPGPPVDSTTLKLLSVSRITVFDGGYPPGAQGGLYLFLGDPFPLHRAPEQPSAVEEKGRLGLDKVLHRRGADGDPGDRVLQADEQREGEDARGEGHVRREEHGGERGAEGHGHDEVEGVHLRERALAGHPQQEHEGEVGEHPHERRAPERHPAIEQQRSPFRETAATGERFPRRLGSNLPRADPSGVAGSATELRRRRRGS
jgi:hypothetical protein